MPPPTVVSSTSTSVVPQAQLGPTQEVYCQQPGISDPAACMAQRVELPTPLAMPFAQALQQFTSRALL